LMKCGNWLRSISVIMRTSERMSNGESDPNGLHTSCPRRTPGR
jgi:hypothetical protein